MSDHLTQMARKLYPEKYQILVRNEDNNKESRRITWSVDDERLVITDVIVDRPTDARAQFVDDASVLATSGGE